MTHEYAQRMDGWKPWMKEYRYGIILILPAHPHGTVVTALRRKYAWSQSSQCDAHISFSVQVPRPAEERHLKEIEDLLAHFPPFRIDYGPIVRQPSHPGVVLDVRPQDKLREMLAVVEGANLFDGAIPRKWPFHAHMTIAEMLTWEQTHSILAELSGLELSGHFTAELLSYIVPDENFAFTERATILIGRDLRTN